MCRHCEERSDAAISNLLIPLYEIAALRSRPEGWLSHPEEVLLGCNDGLARIDQRFLSRENSGDRKMRCGALWRRWRRRYLIKNDVGGGR